MRRITVGMAEMEKKSFNNTKNEKSKEATCKTCGKKDYFQQNCRSTEPTCNYYKGAGHWKFDCPKLKKKERMPTATAAQVSTSKASPASQSTTATVAEADTQKCKDKLHLSDPLVKIVSINDIVVR